MRDAALLRQIFEYGQLPGVLISEGGSDPPRPTTYHQGAGPMKNFIKHEIEVIREMIETYKKARPTS